MCGMECEVQPPVIGTLAEHLPNRMPHVQDDGCGGGVRCRSRIQASRQIVRESAGLDPVGAGLEESGLVGFDGWALCAPVASVAS